MPLPRSRASPSGSEKQPLAQGKPERRGTARLAAAAGAASSPGNKPAPTAIEVALDKM